MNFLYTASLFKCHFLIIIIIIIIIIIVVVIYFFYWVQRGQIWCNANFKESNRLYINHDYQENEIKSKYAI